jgi:hypothetical protein
LNTPIDLSKWKNKQISYSGELQFYEAYEPSFDPISSKLAILIGLTSLVNEKVKHQWVFPFQEWSNDPQLLARNLIFDFPPSPPPPPPVPQNNRLHSLRHNNPNTAKYSPSSSPSLITPMPHEDEDFPYDYVLFHPQLFLQNFTSVSNLRGFSFTLVGTSQWTSTKALDNTCRINNINIPVIVAPLSDARRLDLLFSPELIELTRYWDRAQNILTIDCDEGYHIRYNSSLNARIANELVVFREIYDDSPPRGYFDSFDQSLYDFENSQNFQNCQNDPNISNETF